MQYKTMVLELLQQQSELHEQPRHNRQLLPTMERLAQQLKDSHESWKGKLSQAKPGSDVSQIASEALELALHELTEYLSNESPVDTEQALSLDAAMAQLNRPTPPV